MNRIFALAVGIFLSVLLIAPVNAGSGSASGNQQGGKQGRIKQTPQAAKAWHEREKKRYAAKKRAAAMRQKQLSKNSGNKDQQTAK
jgi:hypothetical protein